jgi:hypothetical protein
MHQLIATQLQHALEDLHENIACMRHPDHSGGTHTRTRSHVFRAGMELWTKADPWPRRARVLFLAPREALCRRQQARGHGRSRCVLRSVGHEEPPSRRCAPHRVLQELVPWARYVT